MKARSWPKRLRRLVSALALAPWLAVVGVAAEDGNLNQQLRTDQQRSSFQLKLEQIEQSARQRAAESRARPGGDGAVTPTGPGDGYDSMRLDPERVTEPATAEQDSDAAQRLQSQQAYERDQRKILDERQRRSALSAGTRRTGPGDRDAYAEKRRLKTRFDSQNRRLSLQRKLRR